MMSDRRYGADEHNSDYERGREDERRTGEAPMSNVTPIQHAMIAGLAEYIDPAGLETYGLLGIRCGSHLVAGSLSRVVRTENTITATVTYWLDDDAPVDGPVSAKVAAEWLGAG